MISKLVYSKGLWLILGELNKFFVTLSFEFWSGFWLNVMDFVYFRLVFTCTNSFQDRFPSCFLCVYQVEWFCQQEIHDVWIGYVVGDNCYYEFEAPTQIRFTHLTWYYSFGLCSANSSSCLNFLSVMFVLWFACVGWFFVWFFSTIELKPKLCQTCIIGEYLSLILLV